MPFLLAVSIMSQATVLWNLLKPVAIESCPSSNSAAWAKHGMIFGYLCFPYYEMGYHKTKNIYEGFSWYSKLWGASNSGR